MSRTKLTNAMLQAVTAFVIAMAGYPKTPTLEKGPTREY